MNDDIFEKGDRVKVVGIFAQERRGRIKAEDHLFGVGTVYEIEFDDESFLDAGNLFKADNLEPDEGEGYINCLFTKRGDYVEAGLIQVDSQGNETIIAKATERAYNDKIDGFLSTFRRLAMQLDRELRKKAKEKGKQ